MITVSVDLNDEFNMIYPKVVINFKDEPVTMNYVQVLRSYYPTIVDWVMSYDIKFTYREDLIRHSEAEYILDKVYKELFTVDLQLKYLFLIIARYSRIHMDKLLCRLFGIENKTIYDFNIQGYVFVDNLVILFIEDRWLK